MKRGDVIGMHTFDVIARRIAEIFVCSLTVFGTKEKKVAPHTCRALNMFNCTADTPTHCSDRPLLLLLANTFLSKRFFFPSLQ